MAYRNTYYKIIEKIKNNFTINSFKQITFGTEKDIDLFKRQNDYPFCHIIAPSATNNFTSTVLSFTIVVGDKADPISNTHTEYGTDNSIDIWQNLLNITYEAIEDLTDRYISAYDSIEVGFKITTDINMQPFKDQYPEISVGYICTFSVEFPNPSECN